MKKGLLLLISLLLPALLLGGCSKEELPETVPRPVKAMRIGSTDAFISRWFPGKAKGFREANLAFRVAGTLEALPVDLGDEMNPGDLLARLDPRDYQVALDHALAQMRRAQAAFELASTEYKRVADIRKQDPGAVSQSMVDSRRGQMLSAKAQLNSAQAAVQRAKDTLGYTVLKAPFKGTVVEKFVENFEDVKAMEKIVRLVDDSQVEFTLQLPESLMRYISQVKRAYVVFDAYPDEELLATIKEVSKEASKITRTYAVTLIMHQPQHFRVLSGMAGKARADRDSIAALAKKGNKGAVEVPVVAVFSDEQKGSFVWLIDRNNNTVHRHKVELGDLTDTGILVTGLKEGDYIATAGVNTLVEGQQIKILK